MWNRMPAGLAMLLALLAPQRSWTQTVTLANAIRSTSGTETDVTNDEIQAGVQKNLSTAVLDKALRVVSIDGGYNVAVGIVHRNKTTSPIVGGAFEHSQITEVCQVISGHGRLIHIHFFP